VGESPPGAQMRARVGSFEWAATPLGPMQDWPASLRTAVDICLSSRFPMIVWWGREATIIYNDAYRPMLGHKHPAALGRPIAEVWAEIWDVIGPMITGVLDGHGATWSDDQRLVLERHGFAEETYFTFSYSPIADGSGGVGGVFCAVTETTATVIGTRRLAALQHLAVRLSDAGDVEEVRRRTVEVLSGTPDVAEARLYFIGEEGFVLPGPQQDPAGGPAPAVGAVHVTPVGAPAEAVLVCRCSDLLALDDQYRAFLDTAARHVAAALAGVRQLADERARAQALAELDAAKTVFFSDLSHELRTPLTLIAAPLADALADEAEPLGPRTRERVELAARNTARLRGLVDTMLDFARIEAGRLVPDPVPVDLAVATAAVVSNFRAAVERAGLEFGVHVEELPRLCVTDLDMWDRIVGNLLSNAVKYTHAGRIDVVLRDAGGAAELEVRDTGIGIAAEHLPHLFERFYRVRGSAGGRSHEGAGIGLALVAEFAGLLGGSVTVDSAEGKGSRFTVRVPYGGLDATGELTVPREGGAAQQVAEVLSWLADTDVPAPGPASDPGRPRLLVAEDNADMRAYLCQVLSPHYVVELVADGADALELLRTRPPDLLLADVMMPGLDGFSLVADVRADPATAGLPVLLLSARAGVEASGEGFAAGADDYLVKPFSTEDLLTRLAANLERARARTQGSAALAARRTAAGSLVHAIVDSLDLDELYSVAVRGLGEAFGGRAFLATDASMWPPDEVVTTEGTAAWRDVPPQVRLAFAAARTGGRPETAGGLAGRDAGPVPGLLLGAPAPRARHEAWVHFRAPREVSADERLLADLLGDVLATGIDRALRECDHARTAEGLRAAVVSHRTIGQAVGVLIERHRLTDSAAFERLREASNRRNIKLRDLAERLIRTGEEP
jgi:signal transduction histidine kinase/AmiR/NasT family two-component response regulator